MVGRNYFREILCPEKIFPKNLQEKNVFEEQLLYFGSQSFLMNLYLLFH